MALFCRGHRLAGGDTESRKGEASLCDMVIATRDVANQVWELAGRGTLATLRGGQVVQGKALLDPMLARVHGDPHPLQLA